KSLNVDPFFHLARRYLGDAYYYSGDWNGALEQWESLDDESEGAYPLVRQRSELLRFQLSGHKDPGNYSLLTSFTAGQWRGYDNERPVDVALGSQGEMYALYYKSANVLRISAGGEAEDTGKISRAVRDRRHVRRDFCVRCGKPPDSKVFTRRQVHCILWGRRVG
ncbi:MAG: hypothetical protein HY042_07520, partial [Spirochaetia bacterium]|nr:hypothetical protein [Spirochaetia bacterium]